MTTVGLWLWQADQLTTPTLEDWAAAGVSRVYVKAADGINVWPQFAALLPRIRAAKLEAYGWGYVYGESGEEGPAIAGLRAGAEGWVIDAESEVEQGGNAWTPAQYVAKLKAVADVPILLSSFGQPEGHRGMDWPAWDHAVDGFAPQLFPLYPGWGGAAASITRMYQQYRKYTDKPLYPVGELWGDPTASAPVVDGADVTEFLANCAAGGYDHASLWRIGIMGQDCADAVRAFVQPSPVQDPADAALYSATAAWMAARHSGVTKKVAMALRTWAGAKGLT